MFVCCGLFSCFHTCVDQTQTHSGKKGERDRMGDNSTTSHHHYKHTVFVSVSVLFLRICLCMCMCMCTCTRTCTCMCICICKCLVRTLFPLSRYRPPHGCHMVQRLQALSLATQATHSASRPQVQTGPTRTVTSDLMSATLADAATQLSFAAFFERCIFVSAFPPPPATHPHSTSGCRSLFHTSLSPRTFLRNSRSRSSLLDVPTRIICRGPWLHLLRTMFSSSLLVTS